MTALPNEPTNATVDSPVVVLVVDDQADTRGAYAEYLRLVGIRAVEAPNGVAAIELARELRPDAIIMDYAMPVMDGGLVAQFLKRDPRTQGIPIVMLTAVRALVDDRARCDLYLQKPYHPRDVVEALQALLARERE